MHMSLPPPVDNHDANPTRITRQMGRLSQQSRDRSKAQPTPAQEEFDNGYDSRIRRLEEEVARLTLQIERMSQERSLHPDQPLTTTKIPPTSTQQPYITTDDGFTAGTPNPYRLKLSQRKPKIKCLSNGEQPSFQQWQASIVERLEIDSDHYHSERARMALVWGHTTGTARDCLEPQYIADSDTQRFQSAEEMIALLESYFVSGNEPAESRAAFHRLTMGRSETFPDFKSRFIDAAVKASVAQSEWFFYLWEKITPAMRLPNLGFKHMWQGSFDSMVAHLTAFDMERRNSPICERLNSQYVYGTLGLDG